MVQYISCMLIPIPGCCLAELANGSNKRKNRRVEGWFKFSVQISLLELVYNTMPFCMCRLFTGFTTKTSFCCSGLNGKSRFCFFGFKLDIFFIFPKVLSHKNKVLERGTLWRLLDLLWGTLFIIIICWLCSWIQSSQICHFSSSSFTPRGWARGQVWEALGGVAGWTYTDTTT